jgi:hypothetical protein
MLDNWGSVPGRGNDESFSLCHCIHIGSEAYPVGTGEFS